MSFKKRIIFVSATFFSLFSFVLPAIAEEEKKRILEITYPKIPGVPTPQYVNTGLPEYVSYIFRLAVILIGFVIFGVLLYNGIKYLLSLGKPAKFSEAKSGIFSGFLAAIILLSAYLIFNTINPQLVILKPAEITTISPIVVPGVYLCNYNVSNIGSLLDGYINGDEKKSEEAVKKLKEAMGNENSKQACFRVKFSGNLSHFTIKAGKTDHTLFIVPKKITDEEGNSKWEYDYGLILHEKDNFSGKCKIFPELLVESGNISFYNEIRNYHPKLDFTARSVTVFRKLEFPPPPEAEGVILYEGPGFNQVGWEETEKATTEKKGKKNGETCSSNEECESNYCAEDPKAIRLGAPAPKICQPKPSSWLPSPFFVLAAEEDPNLLKEFFKPNNDAFIDALIVNESRFKEKVKIKVKETTGATGEETTGVSEEKTTGATGEETIVKEKMLYHNVRSIEIKPKDSYFAVLFGDENEKTKLEDNEKCEVRTLSDANLQDDPIGRCGSCGILSRIKSAVTFWKENPNCYPCLESMVVFKGQVLK